MSSSYKYSRSRKPWDIDKLQCRMQDVLRTLEPAFLGEEGKDYEKEDIQFKAKIAHAYSQIGSKIKGTIKVRKMEEMEKRIEELEQQFEEQ